MKTIANSSHQILKESEIDKSPRKARLKSKEADVEQSDPFLVLEAAQELPIKEDISSMEFPIFSLSKNRELRIRTYSRGGKTLRVIPSAFGAATVFDKDILIYCISQMVKAADAKTKVSRQVRINVYPFLVSTQRGTGGTAYERVLGMCRRLKGTWIETNVKTNEKEQLEGFGLIEDYRITQYTKNQKGALELELTLSDWLYRAVMGFDVLTLHPNYFKLSQALERRLYDLGRKHCGDKAWWSCNLPLLQEKVGSLHALKRFKQEIKNIIQHNNLPDYRIALDQSVKPNQVVFLTRDNPKLIAQASRANKINWLAELIG